MRAAGYVYSITHLASGRCYIGFSASPCARFQWHINAAAADRDHPLYDALRRYGVQAFRFEVVSRHTSEKDARREERRLLNTEAFYVPGGFNRRPALTYKPIIGMEGILAEACA